MTKLKPKDKAFAKEYVLNGNNAKEAVAKVEKITNGNYAKQKGHRQMKKPEIQAEIQKVAQSIADRIPDDLLVKVQLEGLEATRSIAVGEEIIETADHAVRHKFLDSGLKLKGAYSPEKSININIDAQPTEKIKELARKLKELDN
jgi:phage terminase small subunit